MTLHTKPCAKCNTPSTESHPLHRCGKCKNVNYCNKACQQADRRAHKLVCRHMTSTIATLNETLLDDGQLKLGKKTTLPYGSFVVVEMPPTPELSFGYRKLITFSPEWLASISHLSEEEQVLTKTRFAAQKDAAAEAKMTPERREALRLEAKAVGEIQRKTLAVIAAKKAAKEAAKDALKNLESE